ncbi:ATP-grasp domain-containing protein [Mycobacterium sp.]|uniref:ATP-grasp domain-containing protein n=1 Tax=Mycobacterium sp. TaxID=1785 RepID=UPI003D0DFA96
MTDSDAVTGRTLPLVAVRYGPRCVPVMQLAEAAAGVCDLLWVIDTAVPGMSEMTNLLTRFGAVVDMDGVSVEHAVKVLGDWEPDALTTFLDAGMVQLACIAEGLGLPFHTPGTADALTDKARQRRVLADAGLDMPPCRLVRSDHSEAELSAVEAEVGWPAVLKPRSAQGSRCTFLVRDGTEFNGLLDALGPNRPEMVLEGYLRDDPARAAEPYGGYVSVESVVADGTISHLALTGRFPPAENFRETGFFIPAALDADSRSAVLDLATRAIKALGVRIGCLHTEVKFTPDGPRIIEVNGRLGGGVPEMLERAAGVSLLDLTLRVALGEPVSVDGPVPTDRIGYRFFLQPPTVSATVTAVEGINDFSDRADVDTVSLHQAPGAALDWRDGSGNHIVAAVGSTDDEAQLQAAYQLLHQKVTVTYTDVRH